MPAVPGSRGWRVQRARGTLGLWNITSWPSRSLPHAPSACRRSPRVSGEGLAAPPSPCPQMVELRFGAAA